MTIYIENDKLLKELSSEFKLYLEIQFDNIRLADVYYKVMFDNFGDFIEDRNNSFKNVLLSFANQKEVSFINKYFYDLDEKVLNQSYCCKDCDGEYDEWLERRISLYAELNKQFIIDYIFTC